METFFDLSNPNARQEDKTTFFPKWQETDVTLALVNKKMSESENFSDTELEELVKTYHKIFLDKDYVCNRAYRQEVIDAFGNARFLRTLINVFRSENDITYDERVVCNKITWDYKCQKEQSLEIKELLLELSDTINRASVQLLTAVVPFNSASLIALARYSSFDFTKDVDRVNLILEKYTDNLSVQNIVDIYSYLYKHDSFSRVFGAIMFESNTEGYGSDELERHGRISIAILEILEHGMTSQGIEIVLRNYSNLCEFYPNIRKRFSMRSNARVDYPRIYTVLDALERAGINIP
jgi:sugar-specific transcriptional regulator TrmB